MNKLFTCLSALIILAVFALNYTVSSTYALESGSTRSELMKELRDDKKALNEDKKELRADLLGEKNKKGNGIKIVNGTVTAKSGAILTVTKDEKTYTVNTDSKTKFTRHFWGKGNLDEISVGDKINVWGRFTDTEQTTIQAMMVRNLSVMKRFGVFVGTITAKTTTNFTVHTLNRGDIVVYFDSNTKFVKKNGTVVTFADLQTNDKVRLRGMWDNSLHTLTEVTEVKDYTLPL